MKGLSHDNSGSLLHDLLYKKVTLTKSLISWKCGKYVKYLTFVLQESLTVPAIIAKYSRPVSQWSLVVPHTVEVLMNKITLSKDWTAEKAIIASIVHEYKRQPPTPHSILIVCAVSGGYSYPVQGRSPQKGPGTRDHGVLPPPERKWYQKSRGIPSPWIDKQTENITFLIVLSSSS